MVNKKLSASKQSNNDEGDDRIPAVLLSVPLDENNHVVDSAPRYDVTKSWSLSESIRVLILGNSLEIEVDIFNLGLDISFATVEVVLWYREDLPESYSWTSERHEIQYGLLVPAATPLGPGRTRSKKVSLPLRSGLTLTHIYGIAYDQLLDKPDSSAAALLSNAPDFSWNPARYSRQVGCLNVSGLGSYGFEVIRKFGGRVTKKDVFIRNKTESPFDLVIDKIDNIPTTKVFLRASGILGGEILRDIDSHTGTLINTKYYMNTLELNIEFGIMDPKCYPKCPPGSFSIAFLRNRDKPGQVTIDGKSKGEGNDLLGIFQFPHLGKPDSHTIIHARFLVR
jgi:hypothetical protein